MSLPRFHLELHLPYFTLQPRSILDSSFRSTQSDLHRKWMDLSFLQESMPVALPDGMMVAYETHVSVVIFGSAERHWTAYCFEDSHSEDEELANSVRQWHSIPHYIEIPSQTAHLIRILPFGTHEHTLREYVTHGLLRHLTIGKLWSF